MRWKNISYFLLFLLCLSLNIYLRLYPAYFPQLKHHAKANVEAKILGKISETVNNSYPEFNPSIKYKLIKELFNQEIKNNKKEFKEKVLKEYRRLKAEYQDKNGQTYLLELDPYCWMRFTELTLKNGYPGNKRVGNKIYDTYMIAPQGAKVGRSSFLFYLSAFLYKVSSFLFPSLTLEKFLFYLPVFFSLVFLILLYFFCRYFFSEITGLFALIFTGLSFIFITHSSAGWFDRDVLSLLFPLLIIWFLAVGFKKKLFLNIFFSLCSAFFLSLFAFTWPGWWFIYLIIFVYFGYLLLNNLSLYHKDLQRLKDKVLPYLISLVVFFIGSVIFSLLIARLEPLSGAFKSALQSFLGSGKSLNISIWPTTYYTVEELQSGNFLNIPLQLHGVVLFLLSMLSLLWIYLKERRTKKLDIIVLLLLWFLFMFIATLKGGIRFVLFLSLPLGIFLGAGLDGFLKLIFPLIKKLKNVRIRIGAFLSIVLALYLVIYFPVIRSFATAKKIFPMMNDSWYKVLIKLKESTPKDSIINSWWDYGDWFKEVSQRRVIFDGQSQNRPLAYWMAQVLLATDENKAINILRMLNNSSDSLFEEINGSLKDSFKSITLLNKLVESNKKDGRSILNGYNLPQSLKKKILDTIFLKTPSSAYFIVDKRMFYIMRAISFLGNWNFPKVYIMKHRNMPREYILHNLEKIFSLSKEKAESLYKEVLLSATTEEINEVLSKREQFFFKLSKGKKEGETIYFDNGIILNLSSLEARIFSCNQKEYKKFKYFFFFDGENLTYKEVKGADLKLGCFFFKDKEGWRSIGLSSKELGRSLFSKLYFMKAEGLKHFKPFLLDDEAGIYVFKIEWENG